MSKAGAEERVELARGALVEGECHPDFTSLREAFEANLSQRGEIGACVAIYRNGEKVVDLWGGWRDQAKTERWTEETFCSVYSISKSMCALGVHMLIDRGLIELDAPVADYWPEFGQAGKSGIRVRHVLSHHCGVIFNDAAAPGDIYRWEPMIRAIEQQQPAWPAGMRGAYNSVNYGFIQGELVRRVDGRMVDAFLEDEVFRPLGAEFLFGAQSRGKHLADMIDNPANLQYRNAGSGESNVGRAWNAMPIPRNASMVNEGHRRALYPSGGGFTTARDLSRIYAMLANNGELDGVRILSREAVDRLQQEQWQEQSDGMMGMPMRMALGFMKNTPPGLPMGPNPDAFGHYGSNGALAFADRERNIAFACTTNFVTAGTGVGDRTRALVEAAFRS